MLNSHPGMICFVLYVMIECNAIIIGYGLSVLRGVCISIWERLSIPRAKSSFIRLWVAALLHPSLSGCTAPSVFGWLHCSIRLWVVALLHPSLSGCTAPSVFGWLHCSIRQCRCIYMLATNLCRAPTGESGKFAAPNLTQSERPTAKMFLSSIK